jgi:hypothetical protein
LLPVEANPVIVCVALIIANAVGELIAPLKFASFATAAVTV